MSVERERRLSIRIGDDERAMLEALAERDGITSSAYIRMYIRRAYREAFGSKKPRGRRGKR